MYKKMASTFLALLIGLEVGGSTATGIELDLPSREPISITHSTERIKPSKTSAKIEFEPLKVEQTGLVVYPGQRAPEIAEAKQILLDYGLAQHTQSREGVLDLYDDKLKTLVGVLSSFCGYENEDLVFDDNIRYIIDNLKELSTDMLFNIKLAYQSALLENHLDGTVAYSGEVYPYYLYTQTDPEWGDLSYPYLRDRSRTIASSACGPTAMATVLSSYLHREILPTEVSDFSVQRGHRYATGTATSLFTDAASNYGLSAPVTVYGKDVNAVYEGIKNNGHMAIALMGKGRFTRSGHYIVLVDVQERNGRPYFVVADPNYPNDNYVLNEQLIDENANDSFVLAAPELIARECKDITWFQTNFKTVREDYRPVEQEVLLSSYTDEEFLQMIPVGMSETIQDDTLVQIAREKQNDEYFLRAIG